MTNRKMPRVGERYKFKSKKDEGTFLIEEVHLNYVYYVIEESQFKSAALLHTFFDYFEPITQDPISQPSISKKEERLPEVGKSYFNLKEEMDFEVIKIEKGKIETRTKTTYLYRADQFWKYFEEIPNNSQKPQIIDELHSDCVNSEVQVKEPMLKVLESMVKSNIPEKGDCGIVKDAKEEIFTHAFLGELIEYEGKKYVCVVTQTNCLPDQNPHAWEEKDCSSIMLKHKKVKKFNIGYNQPEEDCELEKAADEWNTEILEEEKKNEEEKPKSIWKDEFEKANKSMSIPMIGSTHKVLQSILKILNNHEQRINKLEGK